MADTDLSLSADGFAATEADWLVQVEKALKGKGPEALARQTLDDIALRPLYRESDWPSAADPAGLPGTAPFLRGPTAAPDPFLPWDIRQVFAHPGPATTNAEILRDLARGVSSIELQIDPAGTQGVQLTDAAAFDTALAGVQADIATVALDHGELSTAALLAEWAERVGSAETARLAFNIDPLGTLARAGLLAGGLEGAFARLGALFTAFAPKFPAATLLRADARPVHEAGGSEAQELGALIASAVDTLRRLDVVGIAPEAAAGQFVFTLSLNAHYGLGVAKLRAARQLWARCLEALGLPAAPMRIQAASSLRMLTKRDPWVNMLRGTAACFASAVGGADVVTIRPFTDALGLTTELGRRVARNTQIIAMEESQLGRVADPAGGAWYPETLARELAEKAWGAFQQIEAEGGYGASLTADAFQARVMEVRAARAKQIARGKRPITGVSAFPLLDEAEAPVATPPAPAPTDGVSNAGLQRYVPDLPALSDDETEAAPLWPTRLAEPFERLRDHADARAEATGKRPAIFLATLGPLAEHNACADYARNLFAAGGIEAVAAPEPPGSLSELTDAFKASGCALAVLCGADARYAEEAEEAAKTLKEVGVQRLYLAGRPGEYESDWRAAGIDSFVHIGIDMVATLELAHAELGVGG